ncbi:MAG TPA: hypothetical protein EYP98_16390 [Planctomycetes bacterium]|nr:hypothetical protein [Planctomycetota bacterium]
MNGAPLVALLLVACGPALPTDEPTQTRSAIQTTERAPSRLTDLPTSYYGDYFLVETHIDGEGPYTLILDTGASCTILDRSIYRKTIDKLEVGSLTVRHLPATCHDMRAIAASLRTSVHGILGYTVFKDVLLTLDYPARRIRIAPGELPTADDENVVDLIGTGRPYLNLELGSRTVKAVIDSGATSGVGLLSLDGFEWRRRPRTVGSALTIRGRQNQRAGQLATNVQFGPLQLIRPVVRETDKIAHVGIAILKRFRITFDQRNGRIRFEGNKRVR